jgi:hypothetical protein
MLAGRGKSEMGLSLSGATAKPPRWIWNPINSTERFAKWNFFSLKVMLAFCAAVKTARTPAT